MEINAKSKNEAYNLVAQDVPPETIAGTFTVPEYQQLLMRMRGKSGNNQNQIPAQPSVPQENDENISGKDFLQNSIKEAIKTAKGNIEIPQSFESFPQQISQNQKQIIQQQNIVQNKVQYFMDDGIQFKIDNGVLYKKVWETVPSEEYINSDGQVVKPEFQIIVKETGKKFNSTKYAIQQLIWKPVQSQSSIQ